MCYSNLAISKLKTLSKHIKKEKKKFSDENIKCEVSNSDINFKITIYFVVLGRILIDLESSFLYENVRFKTYIET